MLGSKTSQLDDFFAKRIERDRHFVPMIAFAKPHRTTALAIDQTSHFASQRVHRSGESVGDFEEVVHHQWPKHEQTGQPKDGLVQGRFENVRDRTVAVEHDLLDHNDGDKINRRRDGIDGQPPQ